MRLFLLLFACLLALGEGWAQQLLWQRRFSWTGRDLLTDVIALQEGTLLAIGDRADRREAVVSKMTLHGDTLYTQPIPLTVYFSQRYRLLQLSGGQVYIAGVSSNSGNNTITKIIRLDPATGQAIWTAPMMGIGPVGNAPPVYGICEGPNHTLVLAGSTSDPLGLATSVGYLACYDTLGVIRWDTLIREHPSVTACHYVEMTRDGNILVSGRAGSRNFAAEYAQDGFEIRRATFYQSAGRINFDYNPTVSVRQAPGDRYVVSGQIQSNPRRTYLGMHQGWAGPRLWGFEQPGSLLAAQVNQDGGLVYERVSVQSRLMRLRQDSTVVWTGMLGSYPGQQANSLEGFAWLPDSSIIGVGFVRFQGSVAEDWYTARITNMGIPYRPWQPATATQAMASQPAPRPYPSPCSGTLHFAGLAAPGRLEIYGTDGRVHLSQDVDPRQAVDV